VKPLLGGVLLVSVNFSDSADLDDQMAVLIALEQWGEHPQRPFGLVAHIGCTRHHPTQTDVEVRCQLGCRDEPDSQLTSQAAVRAQFFSHALLVKCGAQQKAQHRMRARARPRSELDQGEHRQSTT
jgi:hypothetical protein